ncbi:carboxymuconolactone decarboxylase family protein [Actinoplanes sp. NPDC051851]|uniref:carboxymuconolactone decarboxylase family protein n=1 Tax=Actinoplanes sp. NPDC051851 TaxID=3154753 RepID=UPI00341EEB53
MEDYLPTVYQQFLDRFPEVAEAQGSVARTIRDRSPFDPRTDRLLKLAMAIGAQSEGAVRSNVRKALQHGATVHELHAVALDAITTCGFPTAIAALGWIEEVTTNELTPTG